jgi:hypothetical protein
MMQERQYVTHYQYVWLFCVLLLTVPVHFVLLHPDKTQEKRLKPYLTDYQVFLLVN